MVGKNIFVQDSIIVMFYYEMFYPFFLNKREQLKFCNNPSEKFEFSDVVRIKISVKQKLKTTFEKNVQIQLIENWKCSNIFLKSCVFLFWGILENFLTDLL